MTAVTYTAKRSLIAGHSADTQYALDLNVSANTPGFTREPKVTVNESLSGDRETIRMHATKYWDVQLTPLQGGAYLNAVIEFLDSVEAGESFTWDFYGSVATPHDAITAELDRGGYSLQRVQPVGAGGSTDYFAISFRVRAVVA